MILFWDIPNIYNSFFNLFVKLKGIITFDSSLFILQFSLFWVIGKLLNEFDIITNDNDQEFNIDVYNPYSHDYHNYIDKEDKEQYDEIYIYVEPKENFGFFI